MVPWAIFEMLTGRNPITSHAIDGEVKVGNKEINYLGKREDETRSGHGDMDKGNCGSDCKETLRHQEDGSFGCGGASMCRRGQTCETHHEPCG